MTNLYNKSDILKIRRDLRKKMPLPEELVWLKLRNRRMSGFKFRRQYSFNNYIVDFYCVEKRLAIEIDGDSHFNRQAIKKDKIRQHYIESFGIKFLRFTNEEVTSNIEGVLGEICENLA